MHQDWLHGKTQKEYPWYLTSKGLIILNMFNEHHAPRTDCMVKYKESFLTMEKLELSLSLLKETTKHGPTRALTLNLYIVSPVLQQGGHTPLYMT